jgi:hypothetical protein
VQVIVGNLMMAAREQTEAANREAREGGVDGVGEREMKGKDWTRASVGWLECLAVWMWDSPKTVRDFLEESANLQVVSLPHVAYRQVILCVTDLTVCVASCS